MSILREPMSGNLTMSVMFCDEILLEKALGFLKANFGEIDMISECYESPALSEYYGGEMGNSIKKIIYSFKQLLPREKLKEAKLKAIEIEEFFMVDGKRKINIDPGLITFENFQLATGKNFAHRVYLGSGIFVEVTLQFTKDGIRKLDWTYSDYLVEPARSFIWNVREQYKSKNK